MLLFLIVSKFLYIQEKLVITGKLVIDIYINRLELPIGLPAYQLFSI